jgi:hypothetical protein
MFLGLPFSKETFSSNADLLLPASTGTPQHTLVHFSEEIQSFLRKDLCVAKLNELTNTYGWRDGRCPLGL